MKVKTKIFIFALILSLMFFVTAVAADENISFDQSESEVIYDNTDVEIHKNADNILGDGETHGTDLNTFDDVQKLIDDADEGSTVYLGAKTYYATSSVKVNKKITISGGFDSDDNSYATLDGGGEIRIMDITASNVVIKNILFVNGYAPKVEKYDPNWEGVILESTDGGAISAAGANLNIISCDFSNNAATGKGGAIKINDTATNVKIKNCNFLNNSAGDGGAVYMTADDVLIFDSNFTDNHGGSSAAIDARGRNLVVVNSNFIDNSVNYDGGAIRVNGFNATIADSRFIKNQATIRDGGAIMVEGSNSTIKGNIFAEGFSNRNGGAININANNVGVWQNEFYYNVALVNGKNIYINGMNNAICNNSFYDPYHASMGIYDINPTSSVIENNTYLDKVDTIKVETKFTGFAGKSIQIPVQVYNYRGPAPGTVTLYGYGDHTLVDGNALFTITLPSTPGVLKSFIESSDDRVDITIEVLSHDSIISVVQNSEDDIIVSLGEGAAGNVIVNINGINYFADVVNSTATVKPTGLINGEYAAIVLYQGDGNYESEWRTVKINITQSPVYKITENTDISVKYSGKSTYKLLITCDGKPSGAGESVVIVFNGKSTVVKTDSRGYAILDIDSNIGPGTYDIRATCRGITVTNNVKVSQIIKASDKKVKKSAKATKIKISLDMVDGKYMTGKTLNVKFNGKTYKIKTNSKGIAVWKVKKSMLKKFKVGKKVKYTVVYGKDTLSKKLTIKK